MNQLIVCATDFSPQARSALAWAASIARRDGGQVHLVHVAPTVPEAEGILVFGVVALSDELRTSLSARLQEAADEAAREFGVPVQAHLLRGVPHEEILKHARQADARMIVLGAGTGTVDRWMFGSVAERTVRSADRPVVLVPERPDRSVWTSGDASGAERVPRVVAGLGDQDDGSVVRFVASLRDSAACDVTFFHLYWPMEEYARLGLQGRRDLFKVDPDVVQNLEPALRAKIDDLGGQGTVALHIRPAWGEPASNLLAAVEDYHPDLLVVGAHQRHGVARFLTSSVAERLTRHARYIPVAVVPATSPSAARAARIPTLRTVLAVTDLSVLGNAAVPHAYALVRASGGVVELCHVHEHALPNPAYAYDAPGITSLDRARMAKELRTLVPHEARALGIATHISVVDGGRAAEAIVQAAERLDVDAITLASHGRSGLAKTVLGSVAQEVVHRSHRPVYVVRSR